MTALITLNPIDPGTNTRVTVRLCATQNPDDTGANGQIWWPAIANQPTIQARLFDGDFTAGVDNGSASLDVRLDVLMRSGAFPRVERYDWAGANVTIQRRNEGSLQTLAVMKVESFAAEGMRLALRFSASTEFFDVDVLSATYAGTGGAEGGADIRGQVKPWVFGRAANVEPVFIDQINNVFQVSGYGAVQAISAAYERGSSFGASVGNFATYAALVAASIPPGRWGTCLAQGMIRLGAPPAGVITLDVDGDNAGGFLRRTGAILQRIAGQLGLGANLNAGSFSALDTAVSRNVNIVISEQITFMELVRRMVAPCNAVPGIAPDGRLIVSRVVFGVEQFTLDAQGRQMPPVLNMARQNTSPPYKRIQMGVARSWRVHSLDEVAFYSDLIDRGLYVVGTVYREGDIVASPDKSRWLYINPTPSSGNAPPSWPMASNTFWSNLEPPLAPGAIGIEDGATRNQDGGGNMIAEADTLEGVTFAIAGSLQTVNNQPVAALVGAAFSAVLFGYVPVRGGERLFFGYTGFSDVSNVDSIRAGYNWKDAAGNIFAVDLPQTAMNGTEAIGFSNGKRVGEFAIVPAAAIELQMYVIRPTWSGNGTFFVRRPLLSRSQPGATDGAPAGSLVGGTEASSLAAQAVAAYRPRQNLLFNGRFSLGLNGWENVLGAWRFVRDNRGQFVEQPLGTGGTFVLRSQRPIFVGPGAQMVISLQGFADFAAPDTVIYADIEWRNGTNDTVRGFSNLTDGNGAIINSIVPANNPAYNSQVVTAPSPSDGSGFVRGFVRLVSEGSIPYANGGRVALGVKVEAGTTPSAISDEATDGAVLDNTFGRIRDPEAYNTQAILGPRNTTNLVPTYTVGGSNVTVNLPSHTRTIATRTGPRTLNYGASSGVVAFSSYWAAYIDDPDLTGFASPTVTYTSNANNLLFPGRYQIASGFTPNAAGTGGGIGTGGGTAPPAGGNPGFPGGEVP